MDTDKVLRANLARLATVALDAVGDDVSAAHLEQHLGIDSLALLELVTSLETELGIVIPDEETGRFTTVADVQDALDQHTRTPIGKVTTS
jgi:acyl carrier protein